MVDCPRQDANNTCCPVLSLLILITSRWCHWCKNNSIYALVQNPVVHSLHMQISQDLTPHDVPYHPVLDFSNTPWGLLSCGLGIELILSVTPGPQAVCPQGVKVLLLIWLFASAESGDLREWYAPHCMPHCLSGWQMSSSVGKKERDRPSGEPPLSSHSYIFCSCAVLAAL
jgi:hypothetical protein